MVWALQLSDSAILVCDNNLDLMCLHSFRGYHFSYFSSASFDSVPGRQRKKRDGPLHIEARGVSFATHIVQEGLSLASHATNDNCSPRSPGRSLYETRRTVCPASAFPDHFSSAESLSSSSGVWISSRFKAGAWSRAERSGGSLALARGAPQSGGRWPSRTNSARTKLGSQGDS